MGSLSEHWNNIYKNTPNQKLGWYQKDTEEMKSILNKIPALNEKTLFFPGIGTSGLIADLVENVEHIILNDISKTALSNLQQSIKPTRNNITWVNQDITSPLPQDLIKADVWIDRAVLHFITYQVLITKYFDNLFSEIKKDGYAVFAEFSLEGAKKCAGLDVKNYSIEMIKEYLGDNFILISTFNFTYYNPSGDPRPYVYGLFKRNSR